MTLLKRKEKKIMQIVQLILQHQNYGMGGNLELILVRRKQRR